MHLLIIVLYYLFFFFKQKTAYEMRISDWSSDVCSSDLPTQLPALSMRRRSAQCFAARRRNEIVTAAPARGHDAVRQPARRWSRGAGDQIGRASCRERVCQYV